jgi:hypothetical protein
MSNKQTAVDWFNDEILIHLNFDQRLYLKDIDIYNQAKEMEKEQIEEAYKYARAHWSREDGNAERYYNETHGGSK